MENLNFLFKQTGGNTSSTDNTFGYPEDAVCIVESSTSGNYVKFNNKTFEHFGINAEADVYIVFGVHPENQTVTFTTVNEEDIDKYPKGNVNKIQKGNARKGIIRIQSKPAALMLAEVTEVEENGETNLVWDETLFNVNLHTAENGQKYITIGNALINDNDEVEPEDVFEEVGQEIDDLPFSA